MPDNSRMDWLDEVKWDAQGLVPVIAQEVGSNDVLMFAWMNREALEKTAELGRAVYFSRSRGKLWFKGEESGHVQTDPDFMHGLDMAGPCMKSGSIATTMSCC
jgi:phosphoribosyl-AMP cyclohydrolase